jgi:hypothetical protein
MLGQMDTNETCKILLDKNNTQRVKCYKFFQTDFERELAVHEHVDHKNMSAITDVKTGMKLCNIPQEIKKVTVADINEAISTFTKHFTLDGILYRFKELDKKEPCSTGNNKL